MSRPTIYTIARDLGIHASTVSRALARPEMVRPELRDRILQHADAVGYELNPVARGLKTGRTGMLGLLIPDIENPFFPPLVRAIERAASPGGFKVLLMDSQRDPDAEVGLIRQVRAQVDGLICAAPRQAPRALVSAAGSRHLVLVNRTCPGTASVSITNTQALNEACDSLLALGHRRLALLRGPARSWAAGQRTRAVRRWAERAGVPLVEIGPIEALFAGGVDAAATVASCGATAVVAFDDVMACGVLAGLTRLGLRVPDDVSVVGCDDVLLAQTMTPALTTIRAPFVAAGESAVRLLLTLIRADGAPAPVQVPGEFIRRASTGPVRGTS